LKHFLTGHAIRSIFFVPIGHKVLPAGFRVGRSPCLMCSETLQVGPSPDYQGFRGRDGDCSCIVGP
jgi:hypothetical protein